MSLRRIPIENGASVEFVQSSRIAYNGCQALRLVETRATSEGNAVALLTGLDFRDGTIEVDVAGRPAERSVEAARAL